MEAAAASLPPDPAGISRLRRNWPPGLVSAAVELATARGKGRAKFPGAQGLMADVEGMEMATSEAVAAHKAARFARLPRARPLLDLCCGIGGDAMAFVSAGLDVIAVDRDPVRAWMAAKNSGCPAVAADTADISLRSPFHIDPGRRGGSRRVFRLDDYRPGPGFLEVLIGTATHGAVKLSPGIDHDELDRLPALRRTPGELEFIGENERLPQAVLWTGDLAGAERRATLISPSGTVSLSGRSGEPPVGPRLGLLFTVAPPAERARLVHLLCRRHGIHAIHPSIGILTGPEPVASPWLTPFELLAEMPWHEDSPRRVLSWLAEHRAGVVEVKTRGGATDPARAQKILRCEGDTRFTVFVLRFDRSVKALVTRRV